MFKKLLLLFPYFQRLEKNRAEIKKHEEERNRQILELRIKERAWEDKYQADLTEEYRLQAIREKLLNRSKIIRLNLTRQTF